MGQIQDEAYSPKPPVSPDNKEESTNFPPVENDFIFSGPSPNIPMPTEADIPPRPLSQVDLFQMQSDIEWLKQKVILQNKEIKELRNDVDRLTYKTHLR